MKTSVLTMFSFLLVVFSVWTVAAQIELEWTAITDPVELQELVSGKAIDGKYWMHYYRDDGNMAYYYPETDAMSVRKWEIDDDGKLCMAVYSKPDRIIDCVIFQQALGEPTRFRTKWSSGVNAFEFFDEPPEKLSNALNDIAGVVQ